MQEHVRTGKVENENAQWLDYMSQISSPTDPVQATYRSSGNAMKTLFGSLQ